MKGVFSTAVIAAALALGVPSNGAEAVRLAPAPLTASAISLPEPDAPRTALPSLGAPTPTTAWLLALGFLGQVILRRTRD